MTVACLLTYSLDPGFIQNSYAYKSINDSLKVYEG